MSNWKYAGAVIAVAACCFAGTAIRDDPAGGMDVVAALPTDPELAGVPVPSRRDPRFEGPVDLVIETSSQLEEHRRQFAEHPEWFEDMIIGVVSLGDETTTGGGPGLAERDLREVGPVREIRPTSCDSDLEKPTPLSVGIWARCQGSVTAAVYFIPTGPDAQTAEGALRGSLRAYASGLPKPAKALGYRDPLPLVALAADHIATRGGTRAFVSMPGGSANPIGENRFDFHDAIIATFDQHRPGASVRIDVAGNCALYATMIAGDGTGDCTFDASDLQRR